MVKGFELFAAAFVGYEDCFVVIGGTACDIILSKSNMRPRATKDIDIVLIVENMTPAFGDRFWEFIKDGGYKNGRRRTNNENNIKYEMYRFDNPIDGYPAQIELLSRHADLLGTPKGYHLEPLPYDGVSSLSAIMMDDDLYNITIAESKIEQGLRVATPHALICLKTQAFRNLMQDKESGKHVNSDDIRKHKTDVLKLIATSTASDPIPISSSLMETINWYIETITIEIMQPSRPLQNSLGRSSEQLNEYLELLHEFYIVND